MACVFDHRLFHSSRVTLQEAFQIAVSHHQAGRLPDAEALYRQILAAQPRHADSLHLLGVIAHQVGRSDVALELISNAIALAPNAHAFHSNLGEVYLKLGRTEDAHASYRRAIALAPRFADAHFNLANSFRETGRLEEAVAEYHRVIELTPGDPKAHNNLGVALNLLKDTESARTCFLRAIELSPDYADPHNNLGDLLLVENRIEDAFQSLHRALALNPKSAETHNNLGNASKAQGKFEDAIRHYQAALQISPDYTVAHNNLGTAFQSTNRFDEAAAAYRHALRIAPNSAKVASNLGVVLKDLGMLEESLAHSRRALEIEPDLPEAHSNLLLDLHYLPEISATELFAEHCRWGELHAMALAGQSAPHRNLREANRRIKIGYVSPDFRTHSVAYFIESLLEAHDREAFEIFCYSDRVCEDATTERLIKLPLTWRRIAGKTNEQVASLVREDSIDILVDLAGHTSDNRLMALARKPAPIQVTYAGYCDTTGLPAIDYRLTDAHADPPGVADAFSVEKLIRLSGSGWCYRPPECSPPVGAAPILKNGFVTFGSFSVQSKLNDALLGRWAELMASLPGSRLIIKNASVPASSVRTRILATFASHGITADRIELIGTVADTTEHLATYHRVDIALDSYPYHGVTTTCEALWMGVPVVTLAGAHHASRVGVSLLHSVGLSELIATDSAKFAEIAAALARDVPRLIDLHTTLRNRMTASPLMDVPAFAGAVETEYRKMWTTWCEDTPTAAALTSIEVNSPSKLRIAFADFCGWDFNVLSVDSIPMGGSQSAACYLARNLAKEGHTVTFISNTSSPGMYDGVTSLSWKDSDAAKLRSLNLDAMVCILAAGNGATLRHMLGPQTALILWNQHAHDQAGVQALHNADERAAYDAFAMVSEWQRDQFQRTFGLDSRRMNVRRNAIAPVFSRLFDSQESILARKEIPPVLAYTSTPFRGLDLLLEAFPLIRAANPRSRLRVFSSMKVYQTSAAEDQQSFGALYEKCRSMDGVEYVGSLPQPELSSALAKVSVLAYPNTFAETSCIGVMEAMAAGCNVVTSELGALPETGAGFATFIPVNQIRATYVIQFAENVLTILRECEARESAMESKLRAQVDHMQTSATWEVRTREWSDWLASLVAKR